MSVRSASEIQFPDKQVIINFLKCDSFFVEKDLNKIAEDGGLGPDCVEKVAAYFANKQIRPVDFAKNVSFALNGFQDQKEFEILMFPSDENPAEQEMSVDQLKAAITAVRERANKVSAVYNPNEKVKEAVGKFTWAIESLHTSAKYSKRIPQGGNKFYDCKTKSVNQ